MARPASRLTASRHSGRGLELHWWSGLAVARNGVVYFTEPGLVRDVLRDGDIATAEGVYQLGPDHELHWVVGAPYPARPPAHWGGVYSGPAIQNDFASAVHLSFDSRGDLFVAGGGGYGLYEAPAAGRLAFVEVLRAQGGSPGSLAAGPNGEVVAASGRGLQALGPSRALKPVRAEWPRYSGRHRTPFCACFGDGVAVGPQGQVYVGTDNGDAMPNQGLFEVLPTGRVLWLWAEPN